MSVEGHLKLQFERQFDQLPESDGGADSGQTVLHILEQQPPLRVIRAFALPDGAALVHLHNVSGGVLSGDVLTTSIEVGRAAAAQLTTIGATRLYHRREHQPDAMQNTLVHIAQHGLLEMLPDPLIPFAGAAYQQKTQITLEAGATLFWWETIAPGRTARNEIFAYDSLRFHLTISAQGRPMVVENALLQPSLRPLTSRARLGPYRYFSTFYICQADTSVARWSALAAELTECVERLTIPGKSLWGVSPLTAHGLVVRALSIPGRDIAPGLLACWRLAKQALCGREAIPPRKIY